MTHCLALVQRICRRDRTPIDVWSLVGGFTYLHGCPAGFGERPAVSRLQGGPKVSLPICCPLVAPTCVPIRRIPSRLVVKVTLGVIPELVTNTAVSLCFLDQNAGAKTSRFELETCGLRIQARHAHALAFTRNCAHSSVQTGTNIRTHSQAFAKRSRWRDPIAESQSM